MSSDQLVRLMFAGRLYLLCFQKLAVDMLSDGVRLYKCTPKSHYFDEMLSFVEGTGYNPRFFHCFGEEDYIGKMTKLASQTHGLTVLKRTLQRYIIFFARNLQNMRHIQ